jgi:hypothetical protein
MLVAQHKYTGKEHATKQVKTTRLQLFGEGWQEKLKVTIL